MATYSSMFKILVLYMGISIMLYAVGVNNDPSNAAYQKLFSNSSDSGILGTNQQYNISSSVGNMRPNISAGENNAIGGSIGLIEVLKVVWDGISLILAILTTIPALFLQFPPFIQLFVGVPMAFIAIVSVIYFVRSGS